MTTGRLPCPPGSSPFHLKGLAYRGLAHFMGVLPGGLDAVCEALDDPALRDFVRQPFLASAWYDLLPIQPITQALARLTEQPFAALVRAGTTAQARYDALHVFHRMYDGATVHDMHARIPRFNAQYMDSGRTEVSWTGPTQILSRLHGAPAYAAEWQSAMMAAYTEESARIAGATGVVVTSLPPVALPSHGGFRLATLGCELRWD
ncbi:MAG TPA: hypothetical protein VHS09_14715 [Polyangiaceae bacterium]|jgi:hypothetical protein|nr:hypothetical protein [Polyangiaceae bacterium]